jgi:hypothetical protein
VCQLCFANIFSNKWHSQLKMPVDVAVEDPGAGVVSSPANSNIVAVITNADNITTRRVVVVVIVLSRGANNIESVSVQVEGMRSTNYTRGHGHLNDFVPVKVVDRSLWKELFSRIFAAQKLQQDRKGRGLVSLAVNGECKISAVKGKLEVKINVCIPVSRGTRLANNSVTGN